MWLCVVFVLRAAVGGELRLDGGRWLRCRNFAPVENQTINDLSLGEVFFFAFIQLESLIRHRWSRNMQINKTIIENKVFVKSSMVCFIKI